MLKRLSFAQKCKRNFEVGLRSNVGVLDVTFFLTCANFL